MPRRSLNPVWAPRPGASVTVSVFDLFKIGIGPSTSRAVGSMRAAKLFAESLGGGSIWQVRRMQVHLFGSRIFAPS